MSIIPAIICVAAALIFALIFGNWIKGKIGTGRENARVLAVVRGRLINFWSFQYLPVIVVVVIVAAAAGISIGWKQAAVCLGGSLTVFIPVILGSFIFPQGITAAYNQTCDHDIRQAVRCGYRTGSVYGSLITGLTLAVICAAVMLCRTKTLVDYAPYYALGAALVAVILHTGGDVYSTAYSMAVPSKDFTDRSGAYAAYGSDISASYIIAICAAVMLVEVAVDTSGVTSTFTAGYALRFPVMVYACGIAGSVIGALVQRASLKNDPSKGAVIGSYAAGIITVAGAAYFSLELMESMVYAWPAAAGIIAGLIVLEVSRLFSPDSKLFINGYKSDKRLGKYSVVLFELGTGMISTAVYAVLIVAAVIVSYMFARFYGVAMCAVGLSSILGSIMSIEGIHTVSGAVGDIIEAHGASSDQESESDFAAVMDTVAVRNSMSSKTYATLCAAVTAFGSFCALYYATGETSIDLMSLRVFAGCLGGVTAAFFLAGMIIGSLRITGRIALRDIGRNDDETGATSALRGALFPAGAALAMPTLIGLLAGVQALTGFVFGASLAGCMLVICTDNAGPHFEDFAIRSLSSLIKMMVVFSIAFLPVFIQVGGFLFR